MTSVRQENRYRRLVREQADAKTAHLILVAAANALSGIAVVAREEINRLSEADEPDEIRAAGIDAINSLCEALGVEL